MDVAAIAFSAGRGLPGQDHPAPAHMNRVVALPAARSSTLTLALSSLRLALRLRALSLSCLTTHYAHLWHEISATDLAPLGPASEGTPH